MKNADLLNAAAMLAASITSTNGSNVNGTQKSDEELRIKALEHTVWMFFELKKKFKDETDS